MNITQYITIFKRQVLCLTLLIIHIAYSYAGEPIKRNADALISDPIICEHIDSANPNSLTYMDSGAYTYYNQQSMQRPLLALKTNLLFDATLMPNFEIEVPIGRHWSVNGEYLFPWWQLKNNQYCLEILSGNLEGRYWLESTKRKNRQEVLMGHFVGVYAGWGKYDVQWKENGYQGEFFIAAGISYGWATSIARNLHLELSIGVGLLRTNYRHYKAQDDYQTLMWKENGNYTWLGPTKAKISLVWLLHGKEKKGGKR